MDPEIEYDPAQESDSDDDKLLEEENPLLARVQEALTKQLSAANERLRLANRDKAEELKRATKEREELGTELYQVQQQLAKLQMSLENAHDNCNIINKLRLQAEEDQEAYNAQLERANEEVKAQQAAYDNAKAELDKLTNALKQFESHNDNMKKEIAVTRRATYRAEESIVTKEKQKQGQDVLIDSMNEQLKQMQEELGMLDAQLIAQRQETQAARDTLSEAATEMEIINLEKKQLLQQWQSSLIAMQRRDEALQTTEEALRKQQEELASMDGEISAIRAQTKQAQTLNEKLTSVLNKVTAEVRFLDHEETDFEAKKQKYAEEYQLYKQTIEATEREMMGINSEKKRIFAELSALQKEIQKVAADAQKMEEEIAKNVSSQTTQNKQTASTEATTDKIRSQLHEREMQIGQLHNELSRIRMDILNTAEHNKKLSSNLEQLVTALRQKEGIVEKYQVEIRRRNDAIEKKQSEVDKLNRRYDQLTSQIEDANTGPLEATIHNMSKAINQKAAECQELQRQWMKHQTQLVKLQNERNEKAEATQKKKAAFTVLTQKKVRMQQAVDALDKEMTSLEKDIDKFHLEMVKLNDLISKNTSQQGKLADDNVLLEKDFAEKLKEMERKAVEMEDKITYTKDEKARLLQEILDTEQEIMVWEKKIQLGKETHAAVQSSKAGDETSAMRKEIHRMKLRLDQMKRRQEALIKEMERAVHKHEDIAVKYAKVAKSGDRLTKANVRRAVTDISKQVKRKHNEGKQLDKEIKQLAVQQQEIQSVLERATEECNSVRRAEEEAQDMADAKMLDKLANGEQLRRCKRYVQRYTLVDEGNYALSGSEEVIRQETQEAAEQSDKIKAVLQHLEDMYPHIRKDLERVRAIAQS
eukprot:TRINITY_DN5647_c0_g1_i1.p1 TRINITY_DN5647_c0_g1~~TRINITY_DN5647_c0_g1_i1.p1  ORF type:complete len:873 (+),score=382.53 TRINITY_DN5647_c0_g1_i1:369-2987(+)